MAKTTKPAMRPTKTKAGAKAGKAKPSKGKELAAKTTVAPKAQATAKIKAAAVPLGQDAAVLDRLWETIQSRRDADPEVSHSARLLSRGTAKVAQKFGEEAVECLIEAVSGQNRDALIAESADVLYHLLVLWVDADVRPEEVWAELTRREGVSGVAEKASRLRALRISQAVVTTKIP
jgi:phosphoribosyl-ATP pyrophosphohydrolase